VNGTLSGSGSGPIYSYMVNNSDFNNSFGVHTKGSDVQYADSNVLLDEIKIYNTALTFEQIQLDMATVGIPSGIC
jgi:hypothetical protein